MTNSHSFPNILEDLFHRTGDLGRLLEDGNIEILGRVDRQIKIRGIRVELEEIEMVLLAQKGVKEAAVIDKRDKSGDTFLCAYIVFQDKEEITFALEQIKNDLEKELPGYMIPLYFIPMEGLPLTANGKIDRRALPEPEPDKFSSSLPLTTTLEKRLAGVWAEVLAIDEQVLGKNSHFFKLGGQSLKATLLSEKVHKALQVRLPLSRIFHSPCLQDMAAYIAEIEPQRFSAIEAIEKKEY